MDSDRFDTFTRSLSSRRTALGGLLGGGLAALLGLAAPEAAGAHNYLARCRRIKDPRRRRRCLNQARAHNRTCHPQPVATTCTGRCGTVANNCGKRVACLCPTGQLCRTDGRCCAPESPAATCTGRCGTVANNCGQAVTCPICPAGKECVANGICNTTCSNNPCPAGCVCAPRPVEGGVDQCVENTNNGACSDFPVTCTSSAGCPQGQYCGAVAVGCGTNRCLPVCPG